MIKKEQSASRATDGMLARERRLKGATAMAKFIDGKLVAREGECMDCNARVFVFEGGERSGCDCVPKTLTPTQRAQKEWMEKTSTPKK